jgi:hypothetical protein
MGRDDCLCVDADGLRYREMLAIAAILLKREHHPELVKSTTMTSQVSPIEGAT